LREVSIVSPFLNEAESSQTLYYHGRLVLEEQDHIKFLPH
jgi:hypothetical protein